MKCSDEMKDISTQVKIKYFWFHGFHENFIQLDVVHVQCLTSSRANFAWNFQIHFSLELVSGFDQNQCLMKA